MICDRCGGEVGLIHRCKGSGREQEKADPEEVARKALMMWDAGYEVPETVVILAQAYLALKADGRRGRPSSAA
jgi:hypothetical protein